MALGFLKRKKRSSDELLGELGEAQLPVFPVVVSKALGEIRDPDADINAVSRRSCFAPSTPPRSACATPCATSIMPRRCSVGTSWSRS